MLNTVAWHDELYEFFDHTGPQIAHQIPPMVPEHEAASLPVVDLRVFGVAHCSGIV
jgi:hypothetical protein